MERREQRRKQLVEAGFEAFGTRGFHAVGVRDVCAEARLTERYFYESFPNREALFLAVYEHSVAHVMKAVTDALSSDPDGQLRVVRTALAAYLDTLRAEPRLARIILIDVLTVGEDVGHQSRRATHSFAKVVSAAIRDAVPSWEARQLDPDLVASGLVGSTIYLAMQWAFSGFREPTDHILNHCALFYEAIARAEGF